MSVIISVPRRILDDQQSEDAHKEFEDHAESFHEDIENGHVVPDSIAAIEEDDYILMSPNVIAPAVRQWAEDNNVPMGLLLAFYECEEEKAEWHFRRTIYDEEAVEDHICFDVQVYAEFQSRDHALMFKLRWGGR
jgi:hypothetical protein